MPHRQPPSRSHAYAPKPGTRSPPCDASDFLREHGTTTPGTDSAQNRTFEGTALRTPASTYRLQITEDFDLLGAAKTARLPARARRGLGLPLAAARLGVGQQPRVRRRRPLRGRPLAGSGLRALRAVQRGPPARHGRARRHRAQPRRRRHAVGERSGGGTCSPTARTRRTPRPSTSTGRSAAASCGSPSSATTTCCPTVGSPTCGAGRTSCTTTTTASRSRPAAPTRGAEEDPDAVHARQHYELVCWRRADADLNYRRFFAVNTLAGGPRRGPGVVREARTRRSAAGSTRAWSTGCGSTTPTACATRSGYLADLAEPHRRRLRAGREDPRARRGAADGRGPPPAPPATTRWRWSTGCSSTRRRAAARAPRGPAARRAARLGARWCTTPSAPSPTASCAPRSAGSVRELGADVARQPTRRDRRVEDAVAELLACFPVYRSYLPEGREHLDGRFAVGAASTGPTWRRRSTRSTRSSATAPRPRPAVPADQRHGDGQGRRGLRVLPLVPAHLAQRGRRRPGVFSCRRGEFHDAMRHRSAMAARDDRRLHPRHQARRGRPRPDRGARRGARAVGGVARPAARARAAARPRLRQPALAGGRRRLAGARRDRDLHAYAEKAMREAGDRTTWTAPDADYEAAVHARGRRRLRRPRRCAPCSSGVAAELAGPRAGATRWRPSCSRSPCPACPTSTRAASCGSRAWSTPTTAVRSTSTAAATLLRDVRLGRPPAAPRRARRRRRGQAAASPTLALRLRRDRPELFTDYAPAGGRGRRRRPRAGLRPRRRDHGRHPAAGRLAARGGWGDTDARLPAGPLGRPAHRARRGTRRGRALADLLAGYPVALLVERPTVRPRGRFDVWAPRGRSSWRSRVGDRASCR